MLKEIIIGDKFKVGFDCPKCGNHCKTETFTAPWPDMDGENYSDSLVQNEEQYECPHCGRCFDITVSSSTWGADVEVEGVDDFDIQEEYEGYAYIDETLGVDTYHEQLNETIEALEEVGKIENDSVRNTLYRNLYANTISVMESYLLSKLKTKVLTDLDCKRKFVEGFKDYGDKCFKLSDIYKVMADIDKTINKTLSDIIYHNLGRVSPIYKAVFGISIIPDKDDFEFLMKAVGIRHDIVHRNGKNKDGEINILSASDVQMLAQKVSDLIKRIEDGIV